MAHRRCLLPVVTVTSLSVALPHVVRAHNSNTPSSNATVNDIATSTAQNGTTQESSHSTTESNSNSNSGNANSSVVWFIISAVGVGALVSGILGTHATQKKNQATAKLQRFLQENHALVSRDVIRGYGDVLDIWIESLRLSGDEDAALRKELRRPAVRQRLLRALDAQPLETQHAMAFAAAVFGALENALSAQRLTEVVYASLT